VARAQSDPDTVKAAQARIEKQLREDATNLHGKAQRDRTSRAEFEGAAALYDVYLSRFGKRTAPTKPSSTSRDRLLPPRQEQRAATHYMATARRNPKGPLTHDALYNAISALERMRHAEFERKTKGESEVDKKFTEAMELYIQLYPNDPDIPELLFRQGKLYYDHQVYDAAFDSGGFCSRSTRARSSPRARESSRSTRSTSRRLFEHRSVGAAPQDGASFQGADKQKRLDTLIVQSVFKQGEQLGSAGKHGDSAPRTFAQRRNFRAIRARAKRA